MNHIKSYSNKVEANHKHYVKSLDFLPQSSQLQQIKAIKIEMRRYIEKMGRYLSNQTGDYL